MILQQEFLVLQNKKVCKKVQEFRQWYREFLPYVNFISANFITAIFQNFPKIYGLCVFIPTWLMRFWAIYLPDAILFAIYFVVTFIR